MSNFHQDIPHQESRGQFSPIKDGTKFMAMINTKSGRSAAIRDPATCG